MSARPSAADPTPIRVLCVEDNPDDMELLGLALERTDPLRPYQLHRVEEVGGFIAALDDGYDVILCDFNLPRFSPYAALQVLLARQCQTPLVVVTRAIGEEAAVHVLRCGAKDYVTKDKLGTLPQVIDRVMGERRRILAEQRLSAELELAYRRLKELSGRMVTAQERERTLIARELHDQLGQTMTAVVIHLHAARRSTEAVQAAHHADTAMAMAHQAVAKIKSLSFALRPAQLDLLGMGQTVQTAVERLAEPAGLAFEVITRGTEPQPLGENASVAVRLAQEAVTNIVRHANATHVCVRLRFLPGGRFGLLVCDDGKGFDPKAVLAPGPSEHNLGLYGMIERTELVGGRLHIRTRPGQGVAIRAIL